MDIVDGPAVRVDSNIMCVETFIVIGQNGNAQVRADFRLVYTEASIAEVGT